MSNELSFEEIKKKFKIVVVDDSDFSRKGIIEILEEEEFNIVGEANSAEQAIKIGSSTTPHLYIIDIVMPEVSGLELIPLLREIDKQCLIIIMSSLSSENIVIESISAGANDFLKKPFDKKDLIITIEKLIRYIMAEKSI